MADAVQARLPPLFDLTGKVAVVTGSSKGIGRSIVEQFAAHGAKVVVSSRKREACEPVAEGIRARGGEAMVQPCHIGNPEDLEALVDATVARFGGIDILVCNAAVNPYHGPSAAIPDAAYDRVMDCNVKSNFKLCNRVIPIMVARGEGVILIVSSLGGMQGSENLGVYCLSKAADMQLARNIAVEWGPRGIRANCLAPGLIRTDFARAIWENPDSAYSQALRQNPIQRIGEPEEVAGIAVCLASRAGAYVTGQTIAIDGGKLIGRIAI